LNRFPHPRRSWLLIIFTALWCISMAVGATLLARYEYTPAKSTAPSAVWPAESSLERDPEKLTLVMAVHANCPCTRASLGELALLLARCPNQLTAYILFTNPAHIANDSVADDLRKTAVAIPNLKIINDDKGLLAGQFHAQTSGEVFVYDISGKLRFSGGITSSRGHAGDNDGRSAVESLLHTGICPIATTPVFGCSL
jgi:hypothetical protein